jgi:hypothetical protein
VKCLALLVLLLVASSVAAAPAPSPKPKRKAERPAAVQTSAAVLNTSEEIDVANVALLWAKLPERLRRQLQPAQPPNADPPG